MVSSTITCIDDSLFGDYSLTSTVLMFGDCLRVHSLLWSEACLPCCHMYSTIEAEVFSTCSIDCEGCILLFHLSVTCAWYWYSDRALWLCEVWKLTILFFCLTAEAILWSWKYLYSGKPVFKCDGYIVSDPQYSCVSDLSQLYLQANLCSNDSRPLTTYSSIEQIGQLVAVS